MKRHRRPTLASAASYPALRELDRRLLLGLAGAAAVALAAGCAAEASDQPPHPHLPGSNSLPPPVPPNPNLRGEPPAIDLPRTDAGVPSKPPPSEAPGVKR